MLISKKITKILVFVLFFIGFIFPSFSRASVIPTTEELGPFSVILKATGLTPGETVKLWVNGLPPTPSYSRSYDFTVNDQGEAFHSFNDLVSFKYYKGGITATSGIVATLDFRTLKSNKALITSFKIISGLTNSVGVINNQLGTISINVPHNTDITRLPPTIDISQNATISPASLAVQDFTNPVVYKVTAEDGSTWNYTVTVTVLASTPPPTCTSPQILDPTTNTCTTPNTKTTYTLLAPLPGLDGADQTIDTQKSDTNPCPFGKYLNIMIKLFFGIAGVLAVVMIVMGGIEYMTSELVSSKEAGKESIRNALLGLLLALGAWLILNTLNPDLLNICLNTLPTAEITIQPETETTPWTGTSEITGTTKNCTEGYTNVAVQAPGQPNKINVCKAISVKLGEMLASAKGQGIILSGSGSRTYDEQVQRRRANKCPDIYNSPSTACTPQTAKPGTSMHEAGKAVDFNCNGKQMQNSSCFAWLKSNAVTYGFKNLASEPWHWSTNGM